MIRGHFKRLTRQTLGYGVGVALNRFAGVILVPIYTRVLSPADYGAWGVVNSILTILALLVTLGLDTALARFFFDTDDPDQQRRVVGTALWTVLLWSLALVGLAFAATPTLAGQLLEQRSYALYLRLALLSLPFTVIHVTQLLILRVRFALVQYNVLAFGNLVLGAGLSVLLAVGFGYGLPGVFIGILLGYVVTSAIGWWINRAAIGGWDWALLRPMLRMGLPLLPASLGYWTMTYVDRWFLARAIAPAELGLYEAAYRVISVMALITTTFQYAWGPFSYSIEQREGALRTYAKALTYYALFALGGALALGLFAREALFIFTPPAYHRAYPIVALLSYAPVAYGAYVLLSTGANLAKKTAAVAVTTSLAALVNLLLNWLLITRWQWGIAGAAIATGISYLLAVTLLYGAAQRVYPIPYEGSKVLRALIIQAGLMAMLFLEPGLAYGNSLALRLGALCAYPLLLWLCGCFEEWELRLIVQAVRQPRRLLGWMRERTS